MGRSVGWSVGRGPRGMETASKELTRSGRSDSVLVLREEAVEVKEGEEVLTVP